jgi:hypothetical protein
MGYFLRIFVLVPAIVGCEATRTYYLARSTEQPSGSAESRYAASYTQADTPAVLTPRTDLNKHLDLHPKKVVAVHARCSMLDSRCSVRIENSESRIISLSEMQLRSGSLLHLHCLLTV